MKFAFQTQIENLEREIEEKRTQMRVLEQRIVESGEASAANAPIVEMQQVSLSCQFCYVSFPIHVILAWDLFLDTVFFLVTDDHEADDTVQREML